MNHKGRIRRLIGEGFWVAVGQVLTVLGSLFQVRVLTEYLEPAQYGELQIALTISGLVTSTLMASVAPGITRYYSISTEKSDTSRYLEASKRLVIYASLVVLAVSIALSVMLFFADMSSWILLGIVACGVGLFSSYSGTLGSIQNAARQRIVFVAHSVANAWLKIVFSVLLIIFFAKTSLSVALGFLISAFLVTVSQLYFLRALPGRNHDRPDGPPVENWSHSILQFSRPFFIWGIFGWMQQSSSKWALGLFSSTDDVGLFSALFQLGYVPLSLVSTLLMTFVTPILYSRVGDAGNAQRVSDAIKSMSWLGGVLLVGVALAVGLADILKTSIFDFAVGEKYKIGASYLPIMVLAGGLFAVGLVVSSIPSALNMPSKLLFATIGSSILGITSSFVGAYFFSLDGAVYGLVIHSSSYLILCIWSVLKIMRSRSQLTTEANIND